MRRGLVFAALAFGLGATPAVAEVHTVKIYFDWNSIEPTFETRNLAGIWAEQALVCRRQGVKVIGHADRSQSDARSLELSAQRAERVRSDLVRNGVSPTDIMVEARGETAPAVASADGIREPLNRRVDIIISCPS